MIPGRGSRAAAMGVCLGAMVPSVGATAPPAEEQPPASRATTAGESRTRSGTGLLIAGGITGALGLGFRVALEGFWFGTVGLPANDPFQRWSISGIATVTNLGNAFVAPGLAMVGVGAYRRGRAGLVRSDVASRRGRLAGWALLGAGAGLFAVTRAAALPVLRSCSTNGCAYGYLESTYWVSAVLFTPGLVLTTLALGASRGERDGGVTASVGMLPARAGGRLQVTLRW
jgi:hypothetical protein